MSKPGQVYLDQVHPEPERHLRIVLAGATQGKVPVINITDRSKQPSSRLALRRGCHLAVTKDSTLAFFAAMLVDETYVDNLVKEQKHRYLSPTLLQQVVQMVKDSSETPGIVKVALGVVLVETPAPSRFLRQTPPKA